MMGGRRVECGIDGSTVKNRVTASAQYHLVRVVSLARYTIAYSNIRRMG